MKRNSQVLVSMVVMMLSSVAFSGVTWADKKGSHIKEISQSYLKKDAKNWRIANLREIEIARQMSTKELVRTLAIYRSMVKSKGADGLESGLIVLTAELASRGMTGQREAKKHLKLLAKVYKPSSSKKKSNGYVPLVRPKNPVVHFVAIDTAKIILEKQIKRKQPDPDGIMNDLCSDEALVEYEIRWGSEKAQMLKALCKGMSNGPAFGSTGPGFIAGISVVDCLMSTQEQPRADRLTDLTQACVASIHGSQGNPLTIGDTYNLSPSDQERLRNALKRRSTEIERQYKIAGYEMDVDRLEIGNNNYISTLTDKEGAIIARITITGKVYSMTLYDEQGVAVHNITSDGNNRTETYFDGNGVPAYKEISNRGSDGRYQPSRAEAYENGHLAESVDYNSDGGYTVKRYDEDGNVTHEQRYDANGKPVNTDGSSADSGSGAATSGASSPGSEVPNTPECRKLHMELLRERIGKDLSRGPGDMDPRVINPNPDEVGGKEIPDDLKCLGISADGIDGAMKCNDFVQCPEGEMPGEDCACVPNHGYVLSERNCQYIITCADGALPKNQNGQCVCDAGQEIFADPIIGGGPLPDFENTGRANR